jgi:hypothetical protein
MLLHREGLPAASNASASCVGQADPETIGPGVFTASNEVPLGYTVVTRLVSVAEVGTQHRDVHIVALARAE